MKPVNTLFLSLVLLSTSGSVFASNVAENIAKTFLNIVPSYMRKSTIQQEEPKFHTIDLTYVDNIYSFNHETLYAEVNKLVIQANSVHTSANDVAAKSAKAKAAVVAKAAAGFKKTAIVKPAAPTPPTAPKAPYVFNDGLLIVNVSIPGPPEAPGKSDFHTALQTLTSRTFQYSLSEIMFEAAIETLNADRIKDLITNGKHTLLTESTKVQLLKRVIDKLPSKKQQVYDIFKSLLENNFFIPKNALKSVVHNWTCPLYPVAVDPKASEIFLEYNGITQVITKGTADATGKVGPDGTITVETKDFFKNENNCNYVRQAVMKMDFVAVANALEVGCNPKIRHDGTNALDELLARNECEIVIKSLDIAKPADYQTRHDYVACEAQEDLRTKLIEYLKSEAVTPSINIKNFENCFSQRRFSDAATILGLVDTKFKGIKNDFKPRHYKNTLRDALLTRNVTLINEVLPVCLPKLEDPLEITKLKLDYVKENIVPADLTVIDALNKAIEEAEKKKAATKP